jgi:hypothetical protein
MGLEKDTLEALGIITREERRSSGEFAPGSFERRDELYQGFVELGGDTDVRSSSEIPADVQRAFKERYGFEYKPEDVDTLGEPRLGNKDIKGLEGGTNGFRMSSNKSFLREEAQASINVVKKGIEGLKRAKENITDKETFLQHGVDFATASFLRSSQAQLDVLADRRQSKVIREVSELLNSTLAGRTDKAAKIGFHTAVSSSSKTLAVPWFSRVFRLTPSWLRPSPRCEDSTERCTSIKSVLASSSTTPEKPTSLACSTTRWC